MTVEAQPVQPPVEQPLQPAPGGDPIASPATPAGQGSPPSAAVPPVAAQTTAVQASVAPAIVLEPAEVAAGIAIVDQNVMVPATAYRTLLKAATDAGRQQFEDTVRERIVKLGFADLADLLQQVETEIANPKESTVATTGTPAATPAAPATPAAAITQSTAGAQPQATPPLTAPPPAGAQPTPAQIAAAAADDPANDRRLPENVRKRVAQFRDQMRGRAEAAETQAKTHQERVTALEGQLQAQVAAEQMKIQMVQAGVKEIDFAWHQLSNEIARLKADSSPEAKEKLKTFDVAAWAAELRKTRPYLFGEQVVPATSPAPGAPAGAAPTPAAVTGGVTTPGTDARNLPPDQFRKRMDELGVRYTGYSSPMKRA